jgi:cephalosporin hydroxylase
MKLILDTSKKTLIYEAEDGTRLMDLYSDDAFELLSAQWLKVGWNQKYPYAFSWLGRPIIQIPEDIVRIQEVIYQLKPDVIVETGIAHGGSLVFFASLCKLIGKGRVIGIDVEIRPHNRQALEHHTLFPFIELIEGNSIDPFVVGKVESLIGSNEVVLVVLDSCHDKKHVFDELNAYHKFVSLGSYIVATDGSRKFFFDVPRGNPEWFLDNPMIAASEFSQLHPEFVIEQPPWPFNESQLTKNITHWPGAWLKRIS